MLGPASNYTLIPKLKSEKKLKIKKKKKSDKNLVFSMENVTKKLISS
jgi:hypothetical protein